MAGPLNSRLQNPRTLDGRGQELGRYCHHLFKFILLKTIGEQGGGALDPQKFVLLPPGNVPLSHITTYASDATDLGAGLAKYMARNNYIPSGSLSGPICKMGIIRPPQHD